MAEQIQDVLAKMDQQFQSKFDTQFNPSNRQTINAQEINPQSPYKNNDSQLNKQNRQNKVIQDNISSNQQQHVQQQYQQQPKKVHLKTQPIQIQSNSYYDQQSQSHSKIEQEQEDNHYKQLSNKLETALQKIQSTRKVQTPKANDMHTRFQFYQKKKQRDIQEKRKEAQAKRVYGIKDKPSINQHSKNIMSSKHQQPLYSRYQKLLQDKKRKQVLLQEQKKLKQDLQYKKYIQELQLHTKVPQNVRSIKEFYETMTIWKNKKQQDAKDAAEKNKDLQLIGATFKPNINKTSKKLIENKPRVPIYQRQIKPKMTKEQFTFTPKINKKKF